MPAPVACQAAEERTKRLDPKDGTFARKHAWARRAGPGRDPALLRSAFTVLVGEKGGSG